MLPNTQTVLVVEDEILILLSIAEDLREAGFEVFEASNSDDAIALLIAHPEIRLLFTDVDMPGTLDGLRLSHFVRDRWPPVKIIVTSGKHIPVSDRLPEGGLFVPKPYCTRAIAAHVRDLLI